jgi:N-acyl-phosphatidylethanolamine-hydrolysing phospholipase D
MQPAMTWVGHITVLAQFGGLNFLTDPVFSERCSPVQWAGPQRQTPPGLSMGQLPRIDVVLLSHSHYDHLDEASMLALGAQTGGPPLFIVPLGLKPWLAKRGIHHAVELDWWEEHVIESHGQHAEATVTLTPAQHWSARTPTDAMRTLWGGFAVRSPDCHLFFAGDTAYSKDFADIRQHFSAAQTPELGGGFDMALLPIGAYEPRWFMKDQHVNPAESVQIFQDLGCKRALAVHWGTFQLTDEALDEPPRELHQALQAQNINGQDFQVLAIGQTWHLPKRPVPA